MNLVYKQLLKEVSKNKIFVSLMLLLTFFTNFMYYFVHYSIDGNLKYLKLLSTLTPNQILYQNALSSNTQLAFTVLISFMSLTAFVFVMFFHRFFKANSENLGTLKALGYKDKQLLYFFLEFTSIIGILGNLLGLIISYFPSKFLLEANSKSYSVSNLVRSVSLNTFLIGSFLPLLLLLFVTFLTYNLNKGNEIATLLFPHETASSNAFWLRLANKVTNLANVQNRSKLRLALRKPITLFLLFTSVICFSTMFLLAYSLKLSSQTIYNSQTEGYHYLVDTHFNTPQSTNFNIKDAHPYLDAKCTLVFNHTTLEENAIAFTPDSHYFELFDSHKQPLSTPESGEIIISPMLHKLYNLQIGDMITLTTSQQTLSLQVSQVAANAQLNSIYISPSDLAYLLNISPKMYTGIWSYNPLPTEFTPHATVVTYEDKIDALNKSFVSNHSSAVINQITGCIIGTILIFLALLLNFQDSTKNILILHLLGYKPPAIRKMLLNIYSPIIICFFAISLYPAILITKNILQSLSLQIGDYMPFQTNLLVIAAIFILLNLIYFLVQLTFNMGIKKIIASDQIHAYIN